MDGKGKVFLNCLVNCLKGTIFMKFVDISTHKIKMQHCFVNCWMNLWSNINNISKYVVIDKFLMERHPTLHWTPCTTHCIALMLENIDKFTFVKETIE